MKKVNVNIDEINKILSANITAKIISEIPDGGLQILTQNLIDKKFTHYILKPKEMKK